MPRSVVKVKTVPLRTAISASARERRMIDGAPISTAAAVDVVRRKSRRVVIDSKEEGDARDCHSHRLIATVNFRRALRVSVGTGR